MSRSALIVDDNRALAEDLGEILEAEGYVVHVYDDPRHAAREARGIAFDVALIDVRMPGMDGVALQRLLKQDHPDARFVLMTAYAEDERIACALREGAFAVVNKPVPLGQLLLAIGEGQCRDVLVAASDAAIRSTLGELLAMSGYRCRGFDSASAALQGVQPHGGRPFDEPRSWVAVVVAVPALSSDESRAALEVSRATGAPAVLILPSASRDVPPAEFGNSGEHARVIARPFAPEVLLQTLVELRERAP